MSKLCKRNFHCRFVFHFSFHLFAVFFFFHFSCCFCAGGFETLGDHAEQGPYCGPAAKKMAVTVTPCYRKISLILSDTGRAISLSAI